MKKKTEMLDEKDKASLAKRNAFPVYYDWMVPIDKLTDEAAGELLKAMMHYQVEGTYSISDPFAEILMSMIVSAFDRDKAKYIDTCHARRENAMKRWHVEDSEDANASKRMQMDAIVCKSMQEVQMHAKDADKDKDIDIDYEKEIDDEMAGTASSSSFLTTGMETKGSPVNGAVSKQQEYDSDTSNAILSELFARIWRVYPRGDNEGLAFMAFRSLMETWSYDTDKYESLVRTVKAYAAWCKTTKRPTEFIKSAHRFLDDSDDGGFKKFWPGTKMFLRWYPVADPDSVRLSDTIILEEEDNPVEDMSDGLDIECPQAEYSDDEELPFPTDDETDEELPF